MSDRTKIQRKKGDTSTVTQPIASPMRGFGIESAEVSSSLQNQPQGHDISRISLLPQAKLTVSQPQDPYEQEADRVADQVMRMETPSLLAKAETQTQPIGIQRKCAACDTEEDDLLKRKERNNPNQVGDVSASVSKVLQSGGVQSLDNTTRNFMESRFGHDFGQVRIHTNSHAADSAQTLNARAYTLGQDIVFGAGQYTPHTNQGRHLLAHELTHVVQQGKATTANPQAKAKENRSNGILEQQGQQVQLQENSIAVSKSPNSSVQRLPEWLNFSSDQCTSERWNCRAAWITLAGVLVATVAAVAGAAGATAATVGLASWAVPLAVFGGILGAIASIAWGISAHKALKTCLDNNPNADAAEKEETRRRLEMLEKRLIELESLKEKDKQDKEKQGGKDSGTPTPANADGGVPAAPVLAQ